MNASLFTPCVWFICSVILHTVYYIKKAPRSHDTCDGHSCCGYHHLRLHVKCCWTKIYTQFLRNCMSSYKCISSAWSEAILNTTCTAGVSSLSVLHKPWVTIQEEEKPFNTFDILCWYYRRYDIVMTTTKIRKTNISFSSDILTRPR